MSTLNYLIEILEDKKNNLERINYLNSILNDKSLAEDNLKKIASKILLENKFLDIYFNVDFIERVELSCENFRKFFKI